VVECTHELNYLIVGNSSSTFIPLNQSSVNPQVIYDACKQASSLYICWTITELVVLQFMLFVSEEGVFCFVYSGLGRLLIDL